MDPILYWNDVALEANKVSHTNGKNEQTGPTLSARALGIVHLAMYDAYAGASAYSADLAAYLGLPAPAGAPFPDNVKDAAVAAAAHATLSKLFPSQKPFFDLKHAEAGLTGAELAKGHEFGLKVAQALLADRNDDPDAKDDGYAASMARGAHRPDPDNPDQGFHAPFYGAQAKLFAISGTAPDLDEPPKPSIPANDEYHDALLEVRSKGIAPELMGTVPAVTLNVPPVSRRTNDETVIGLYWGYDGAAKLGTPPRLYNQIVRDVAIHTGNPANPGNAVNTTAQNARLFALVNVAMADAGILAWKEKYRHDLWRPVLGIREHDVSMGPTGTGRNDLDNACHVLWLPLGAPKSNSTAMEKNFTPNFPAYPSGHATFGAAALHITRLFYRIPLGNRAPDTLFGNRSFVSDELNGSTRDNKGAVRPRHARSFPGGLWQMIIENGRSRVYLGVHWVFDAFAVNNAGQPDLNRKIGGVRLGLDIAESIYSSGMTKPAA